MRSKCCPIAAAMRIPCTPHAAHLWGPYGFYNNAARRIATAFVRLNCVIKTSLPVRKCPL